MDTAKCQNPTCKKAATLQCPKCISLNLPPSYFCSQQCFKDSWGWHKMVHDASGPTTSSSIPSRFEGFAFTGPLRPGQISARRIVPDHIQKPDYAITGEPVGERAAKTAGHITVHTAEQIELLRQVGKIGREILDIAAAHVKPGVTTDEIDRIVHEATIERGAYPSPLNYRNFPKSCCTSVNEVICHGIPDNRPLQDGDIVNLDISAYYKGFHTDLNETFYCGTVDKEGQRLVNATRDALDKAIEMCKPGALYRDVGNVISKFIAKEGFSVVRSYCGHGVGELFHTAPSVPHYGKNKAVGVMKAGHVFTIEPMINEGTWHDVLWPDDWTSVTKDGKRSAQFEHTILITETGCEVLTKKF